MSLTLRIAGEFVIALALTILLDQFVEVHYASVFIIAIVFGMVRLIDYAAHRGDKP